MRVLRAELPQEVRLQDPQRLLLQKEEAKVLVRGIGNPGKHLFSRFQVNLSKKYGSEGLKMFKNLTSGL